MASIKERAILLEQALNCMPVWISHSTSLHKAANEIESDSVNVGDDASDPRALNVEEKGNIAESRLEVLAKNVNRDRSSDGSSDTRGNPISQRQNKTSTTQCPVCFNLEPEFNLSRPSRSKEWIVKSEATSGCPTCHVMEQVISCLQSYCKDIMNAEFNPRIFFVELGRCVEDKSTILKFVIRLDNDEWWSPEIQLFFFNGRAVPLADLPQVALQESTTSVRFEKAKAWMDECVISHESCKIRVAGGYSLPRRVLDIRQFAASKSLRLIEGAGTIGSYACLSYCWGTNNTFVTTTENLNAMMTDIPWTDLPQTYRDAVIVASQLGIPYLWIDALCIIQGSNDQPETLKDWEEQSALMSSIYGNAILTIAAANCQSTGEGFLDRCQTRDPSLSFNYKNEAEPGLSLIYGRWINDHLGFEPLSDRGIRVPPFYSNVLRNRAWCFQEYFLSTRVLSFGHDEMVFDCNSQACCECEQYPGRISRGVKPREGMKARGALGHYTQGSLNVMWSEFVREYRHRLITFPADKLPAISGIAKMFQQTASDGLRDVEYLAGHWDDADFVTSLAWRINPPQFELAWKGYRAPSWSWACVDGGRHTRWAFNPVLSQGSSNRPRSTVFPESRVIAKKCSLATNDPTGAVNGGYILVRGFGLEAKLSWENHVARITRNNVVFPMKPQGWGIWFDREMSEETREVLCWYVGKTDGMRYGESSASAIDHELMILEKQVNRIYKRIGWLTLTECLGEADWGEDPSFLEAYKTCLMGFAIL